MNQSSQKQTWQVRWLLTSRCCLRTLRPLNWKPPTFPRTTPKMHGWQSRCFPTLLKS